MIHVYAQELEPGKFEGRVEFDGELRYRTNIHTAEFGAIRDAHGWLNRWSLDKSLRQPPEAVRHLATVLEWAKGNRGSKTGNPYSVPEIEAALKYLAERDGLSAAGSWLDVNTRRLAWDES